MNKKYKSLTISYLTLFFLFNFLLQSEVMMQTFFATTKLWFENLFPAIFVFFIITDILNNYNFPYYLSKSLGTIINKIYHIPKEAAYILFMSMFSGFPGNSKLIKEQLDNRRISIYDATKILTMTHFSNPLFILYTIGINFLHNKKIGLIILLSHFLTNYLIGLIFRNQYQSPLLTKKIILTESLPLITLLKKSFMNTIKSLINVYGIIIFFALLTKTLNLYLNLQPFSNTLLNGLLEITNGLNLLSKLSLPTIQKAVWATFFLSFGGFSIHLQILSILQPYSINYYIYLLARLIHASISSLMVFIILILINH